MEIKKTILTDTQLAEIRERVAKATPGPWRRDITDIAPYNKVVTQISPSDSLTCAVAAYTWRPLYCSDHPDAGKVNPLRIEINRINADFIAHARTDVPALLDTVDAIKQEAEEQYLLGLEHGSERIKGECDILIDQAKADKLAIDALLAALDIAKKRINDYAENWDCDEMNHKYGNPCRACMAKGTLLQIEQALAAMKGGV